MERVLLIKKGNKMAEQSDCKRQIVKIAANNTELQYYLLSPVDGSRVILDAYTVGYGQEKIDADRVVADDDWAFWDGLDGPGIAAKITDAVDAVALFNKIQTVMDGVDGDTVDLD